MHFRKHIIVITFISLLACISIAAIKHDNAPLPGTYIEPSEQRSGDAKKGYDYLVNGDYLKSGLGYNYYVLLNGKDKRNLLGRTGKAANVAYNFNLIKTRNSKNLVVPNCLQCHGQIFNGKLVIGLGNTFIDFSKERKGNDFKASIARHVMQLVSPGQYQSSKVLMRAFTTIAPYLKTETPGVNAAPFSDIACSAP